MAARVALLAGPANSCFLSWVTWFALMASPPLLKTVATAPLILTLGTLFARPLWLRPIRRILTKKRTLMMGEIWAKLASKYSKDLDIPNFKEVFEPIQTTVGARGGPERVLQAMQAAVELRPTDVVLHADVIDAYPSVDRCEAQ
jgi:hypothetical protein